MNTISAKFRLCTPTIFQQINRCYLRWSEIHSFFSHTTTVLSQMIFSRRKVCNLTTRLQAWYLSIFLHKYIFQILEIYPKKRVNYDILNLKYYIFCVSIHRIWIISQFLYTVSLLYTLSMGKPWFNIAKNWIILLQLYLKHIHKVKFYPSGTNFTQELLVMLVTNIISDSAAASTKALWIFIVFWSY